VSRVVRTAEQARDDGRITDEEKARLVRNAARKN